MRNALASRTEKRKGFLRGNVVLEELKPYPPSLRAAIHFRSLFTSVGTLLPCVSSALKVHA